jgi:hypothetical protein
VALGRNSQLYVLLDFIYVKYTLMCGSRDIQRRKSDLAWSSLTNFPLSSDRTQCSIAWYDLGIQTAVALDIVDHSAESLST